MKKIFLLGLCGLFMGSCAAQTGSAEVQLPAGDNAKSIVVSHAFINNLVKARRESDLKVVYDTVPVNGGKAVFNLDAKGAARYNIDLGNEATADFYAAPDENIRVVVKSVNPLDYTVDGTALMKDMTSLEALSAPIQQEYASIMKSGGMTQPIYEGIMERYLKVMRDFVAENPDSPAVPYAILQLPEEEFMKAYNAMSESARKSIMMPFAEQQKVVAEAQIERAKKIAEMTSGNTDAPAFTLKNLDGKDVSLSDFKGKWVVLDFWGSWCGWCIKGIPALKDAYKKYAGKLEVIGIDCNETEEAWRAGVKKYELPWVNVYNNPNDPTLLQQYGVQGFPTKAIVNPEGKLVDITSGEDPSFYDRLAGFIK